jgi:membrane fusion protein, multidrug efflux system
MKIKKMLIPIILIICLAILSCSSKKEEEPREEIIPVKIAKVVKSEISIPIHTSGRLKSQKEVKLSFKTGGIVSKIFVNDGDQIKSGQVLAKLNLEEIESQVNQAKINYEKTLRDYKRVESLYKDSVVTLEQFQNIKSALDAANSSLNIAKFNLSYSTIISPFDGKVYKKLVEENEIVSPGMPIFVIGSDEEGWLVLCGVTDNDIAKLKIGNEAKVKFDTYNQSFNAKLTKIAASANPMNGLFDIELKILDNKEQFVSGMIASVDIFNQDKNLMIEIPIQAVVEANGGKGYAFTVDKSNNSAKKVEIEIVDIHDKNVIVNLKDDSVKDVVTDGVEFLNDGSTIKIISK